MFWTMRVRNIAAALGLFGFFAVPGFFSHVDSTTGYSYNGGAPSGHVLCGNGTNYVDATTCGATGVTSWNGRNGAVSLTAGDVNGVGNITNNTSGTAANATNAVNAVSANNANTAATAGTANNLAGSPSQCSGLTPFATGITATGNANCTTASTIGGSFSDVTGSRAAGGTYANGTSHMIYVSGYFTTNGSSFARVDCIVGPTTPVYRVDANQYGATTSDYPAGFRCMVPAGWVYSITTAGSATMTLSGWYETGIQ